MSIVTIPQILYPQNTMKPTSSASNAALATTEDLWVGVVTVPKSGTLNKIGWMTGTITGVSYTVKVSVETVAASVGLPVATTNAGKTLYATGAESADITSLTSATVYFTPINGVTGITVNAGDLIAVTIRLTAVSASTVNIAKYNADVYLTTNSTAAPYTGTRIGGAWGFAQYPPVVQLEYSTGFSEIAWVPPLATALTVTYNNASNPDHRGLKFRFPFACRLSGAIFKISPVGDCQLIMYNSDGYTVATGFPITITAAQREATGESMYTIIFPTKFTCVANTFYRFIVLPTTSSNISLDAGTPVDDGAVLGINCYPEGTDFVYTTINGVPSSGNNSWTDANVKISHGFLIDGIDSGSAAGGLLTNTGMNGGLNS